MGMEEQEKPARRTEQDEQTQFSDRDLKRADRLLSAAEEGNAFSNEMNRMSPNEQRSVFAAMKQLQTDGKFGAIELTDFDDDGFLDDASVSVRERGGKRTVDLYDTPTEARAKRDAETLLSAMANGTDISRDYNRLKPEEQRALFKAMQQLAGEDPRFKDVKLVDKDGNGILDDATAKTKRGERDVYDTPADIKRKEVQQDVGRSVERILKGGDIRREIERNNPLGGILKRRN